MKTHSIGIIGGGRITKIFLTALFRDTNFDRKIVVSDSGTNALENVKRNFTRC